MPTSTIHRCVGKRILEINPIFTTDDNNNNNDNNNNENTSGEKTIQTKEVIHKKEYLILFLFLNK